jgi:hypothetical protein
MVAIVAFTIIKLVNKLNLKKDWPLFNYNSMGLSSYFQQIHTLS